ncbi:MAG: GNAT family N-acetyltransferase [Planctomycetota bacterium]
MLREQACHPVQVERLASEEAGFVLPFLDAWLRADVAWSLADEYPGVFDRHGDVHHYVIRAGGDRLLAHAAVRMLHVETGGGRLPIRMVGSVVVHPEARNRGLGSRLMTGIASEFRQSEDGLCILWSDREVFYERAGFKRFGREWSLKLRLAPEAGESGIRPYESGDLVALLMMHLQKPVHVRRSHRHFERLLCIPRSRTFVLEEGGFPIAYASVGKGLDFLDVVHESGGEDSSLSRLLQGLPRHLGKPVTLLLPPWRASLAESLVPHAEEAWLQHLGLAIANGPVPGDFYLEGFDSI